MSTVRFTYGTMVTWNLPPSILLKHLPFDPRRYIEFISFLFVQLHTVHDDLDVQLFTSSALQLYKQLCSVQLFFCSFSAMNLLCS